MQQDYMIAGLRVRMDSFGRTLSQAQPYVTQTVGEPDIVITGDPQNLQKQQPHLSLDDCEYLCTGGSFYRQLLLHKGFMLHASAVVMHGYAYLFSAPCGTGKSTHTDLWKQAFGEAVVMLNDDKPALKKEQNRWYAYGTPWSGKTAQNANLRVPLGGICVLTRGTKNEIEPYHGTAAIFSLLDQTVRPQGSNARGELLELLDDLMSNVPVWKLCCTPTKEAALVSWAAMSKEAMKRFGGKES